MALRELKVCLLGVSRRRCSSKRVFPGFVFPPVAADEPRRSFPGVGCLFTCSPRLSRPVIGGVTAQTLCPRLILMSVFALWSLTIGQIRECPD